MGFEAHPTPSQRTETGGFEAHPHAQNLRKTALAGPKLVASGVHTASQNPFIRSEIGGFWGTPGTPKPRKTPLSGPKLVDSAARTRMQNPFTRCETAGFWGTPRTPTPSQNPFIRTDSGGFCSAHPHAKPLYPVRNWWVLGHTRHSKTIAKPLYQDRIHPLGHYNDLILGMGAGRACAAGFSSIILQHCLKG